MADNRLNSSEFRDAVFIPSSMYAQEEYESCAADNNLLEI